LGVHLMMQQGATLPQVIADTDKIKEVLFNLIGNAMKFTPQGGTITVTFVQKEMLIETLVTDTGTGIDPKDIDKLFAKFSMIPESYGANSQIQGTGLGLYISKSIIELHGGRIWAKSEGRGKGTTFTFSLRIATEAAVQQLKATPVDESKQAVDIIHTGV
ncbi:MAG TPA: ATP-binding protein, partial [Patescibacteria group bacterium]|nr:ATP-binding protein [Patescibacteria group bacterium]